MYKKMLKELIEILKENHIDIYFNIKEEELNKLVEDTLINYKLENDYDFYYVSNMVIKKIFGIYDSHTKVVFKNADFNIPIRLKYIDNKIYVINTNEENKDILYGQILKVNGIDVNVLIEEIEKMVPYSTKEFLYTQIEYILYNGCKLKALPSIGSNTDEFKYTVLNNNGEIIEKYLDKSDVKFNIDRNYTYSVDNDIMTIVYSSCREEYEGQMGNFVKEIEKKSIENNISNYIIDIRGNTGGNHNIIKPLIKFLKDKQVITIIDKYLFSAGRFAIVDLKNIGSKFVGTGIGTTLNCFGNIKVNELGNFKVAISNKYFYYDDNEDSLKGINEKEQFQEFKSKKENEKYFIPQIFTPDYYLENSLSDYINNNDSMKEYASELIKYQMNESKKK